MTFHETLSTRLSGEKRTLVLLVFSLAIVSVFSTANYLRYFQDKYIDKDGFAYLNTVWSVYYNIRSGERLWMDELRSPLLILFIPLDLDVARLTMMGYLLASTLLVFLISHRLTKDGHAAFFASVTFGTLPYLLDFQRKVLSDLPAVTLYLAGVCFLLRGYDSHKGRSVNYTISSALMGLGFIVRFDIAIVVLPILIFLILNDRRRGLLYLIPFLSVAVIVELVSSSLYFGRWIYPPWNFFYSNFFTETFAVTRKGIDLIASENPSLGGLIPVAWFLWYPFTALLYEPLLFLLSSLSITAAAKERDAKTLLVVLTLAFLTLVFLFSPKIDPRVYVTKYFPLSAILSSVFLGRFVAKDGRALLLLLLVTGGILCTHAWAVNSFFTYPTWDPSKAVEESLTMLESSDRRICTNDVGAVRYFILKALEREPERISLVNRVIQAEYFNTLEHNMTMLEKELRENDCNVLLYLSHPEIPGNEVIDAEYLASRFGYLVFESGDYDTYSFLLRP
jgi:hypothetical protein